MKYIKCPKCELNYIKEDEEICAACMPQIKIKSYSNKVENDFSKIVCGKNYGGNSRNIYTKFCKTLGWDISKQNQFGWQTPLYATNADTDRTRDVWFIFYANYDINKLDNVVENVHVVNFIKEDGEQIIEIVDEEIGVSNQADRITFIKTNIGYVFFGVYRLIQNGTTRIYNRISRNYPIID